MALWVLKRRKKRSWADGRARKREDMLKIRYHTYFQCILKTKQLPMIKWIVRHLKRSENGQSWLLFISMKFSIFLSKIYPRDFPYLSSFVQSSAYVHSVSTGRLWSYLSTASLFIALSISLLSPIPFSVIHLYNLLTEVIRCFPIQNGSEHRNTTLILIQIYRSIRKLSRLPVRSHFYG